MLADFYIPRLSNDMKLAVHTNHLVGKILYRNLDPSKKKSSMLFLTAFQEKNGLSSIKFPSSERPKYTIILGGQYIFMAVITLRGFRSRNWSHLKM